jgi:hypothetical protein
VTKTRLEGTLSLVRSTDLLQFLSYLCLHKNASTLLQLEMHKHAFGTVTLVVTDTRKRHNIKVWNGRKSDTLFWEPNTRVEFPLGSRIRRQWSDESVTIPCPVTWSPPLNHSLIIWSLQHIPLVSTESRALLSRAQGFSVLPLFFSPRMLNLDEYSECSKLLWSCQTDGHFKLLVPVIGRSG